jgi:hypothetical protein
VRLNLVQSRVSEDFTRWYAIHRPAQHEASAPVAPWPGFRNAVRPNMIARWQSAE